MSSRAEPPPGPEDADRRLAETGAAIVAAVDELGAAYLERAAGRVLDAWGRMDESRRREVDARVRAAASEAARRVGTELRALFAEPAVAQRATPLEIVRTLWREPTEVLTAAGVAPVVRDPFHERARPGDRYDLAPRSLSDLGDDDLGALQLAWGLAKTRVLRAP